MLTFKKFRAASQSYGRGSDNKRSPAAYHAHKDGEHVATILAKSVQQYESPTYTVMHPSTYKPLKVIYKGGLKAAKAWAEKNL